MMAISRQKRPRREPEEHISESIFDAISPTGGSQDTRKEAKKDKGPTVEELQARLAEVNARLDAQERSSAMDASRPDPVSQRVDVGKPPELNLEGLPDPIADQKAYAAAIIQRGRDYDRATQDWQKRQQEASAPRTYGNPEALWEDFTQANPDYAADESGIRFATSEVAARLAKRGVDVAKFMYTKSDLFFKDVVKEYDKRFGKPETDDEGDEIEDSRRGEERPRPRRMQQRDQDDGDDGRTAGILSGMDNAVRPGPKGPAPGDLIKDLQDIQRKSGYF